VEFSPDGKYLVSRWEICGRLQATVEEMTKLDDGTTKGFIRVFDMPSGEEIQGMDGRRPCP
jgi:hypothetical protein